MQPAPFQLYMWPQSLLLLAPAYASELHSHHFAQITLGVEGPAIFQSQRQDRCSSDLVLIPPDLPHAHPAYGTSLMLFLEPESAAWTNFHQRHTSEIVALPFRKSLRSIAQRIAIGDPTAASAFVENVIGKSQHENSTLDPLIAETCCFIHRNLDKPVSLRALASKVHRSPSRLAHRFKDATGVPLRRYILWRRIRAAAEAAIRGSNLTEAAHAAGFSDSAHLSRTFRSTFGIIPSLLFKRDQLHVTFMD